MKIFKFALLVLALVCGANSFTSCGNDADDIDGSSGWYTVVSQIATSSDFAAITTAVNNHELLTSYSSKKYYAAYDLFFTDDGMFTCSASHFGKYRFSVTTYNNVYHFVNSNTVVIYHAYAYKSGATGTSGKDVVIRTYAGSVFGNLDYCATGNTYTYYKSNNKIYISNGDIMTISGSYLIPDGSSTKYSQYNPSNRF